MKKHVLSGTMKKCFLSIVMCFSVASCFAMTAYAINSPHVIARLGTNMAVAYSETTAGTHKIYGGTNAASSKYAVYFEAQRSAGDKFVKDSSRLVSQGGSIDNVITGFTGNTQLWRLELNPYGIATKSCSAIGYMWFKM